MLLLLSQQMVLISEVYSTYIFCNFPNHSIRKKVTIDKPFVYSERLLPTDKSKGEIVSSCANRASIWMIMNTGLKPLNWALKIDRNKRVSVMQIISAALHMFQKIIYCSCKISCIVNCFSCRISSNVYVSESCIDTHCDTQMFDELQKRRQD